MDDPVVAAIERTRATREFELELRDTPFTRWPVPAQIGRDLGWHLCSNTACLRPIAPYALITWGDRHFHPECAYDELCELVAA